MPIRILNLTSKGQRVDLKIAKYEYKYPRRLNLKPGSKLHDRLRDEILVRAQNSHSAMSRRYASWREIDEKLTAYIDLTNEETEVKIEDVTKPVSIVVPVSYAALETLLGYMTAAFLDEPIFNYEGAGGEDVQGAMLLERVMEVQTRKAKLGLNLHTTFRDGFAYGLGGIVPVWEKDVGFRTMRSGTSKIRKREVKFEGNKYYNIDPYKYYPDPNYDISSIQDSEYQSWIIKTNRFDLLSTEQYEPELYFNARYLKHIDGRSNLGVDESERDRDGVMSDNDTGNRIDVLWMSIKLIPEEWGIGRKKYPEKWLIGLAGDEIIITASPMVHDHNMFPLAVFAPDYDGRSITPISKMETIYGEQTITDFLYNSHIANVRKAVHDMFVYDPLMINSNDVENPSPGKWIRTRKRAWGTGVKDSFMQLQVNDITRTHLADAGIVISRMENNLGVGDLVKGVVRDGGERRSATEYKETKNAAMLKLERMARVGALQTLRDLAYISASHTQQYMSTEVYTKIAGPYEEELREMFPDDAKSGRHLINPLDILIDYDVLTPDGSIPNSGDPTTWQTMFQAVSNSPYLIQNFDVIKIFTHWAKLSGAKNVTDFVLRGDKKIQVKEDEELSRMIEKGNAIPLEGANSATG